jgi:hypothetical protein
MATFYDVMLELNLKSNLLKVSRVAVHVTTPELRYHSRHLKSWQKESQKAVV